jgi:eukaryotic-like serine/threonine-protein kinase
MHFPIFLLLILGTLIPFLIYAAPYFSERESLFGEFASGEIRASPLNISPSTTDMLTYENVSYGVSILYLPNWEKMHSHENPMTTNTIDVVSFRYPQGDEVGAKYLATFTITVHDLPSEYITLNEYTNLQMEAIKQSITPTANFSSIFLKDNIPAYKAIYTFKQDEKAFKRLEIWSISNGKAFILSFLTEVDTYSDFLPSIEKMIESFRISK